MKYAIELKDIISEKRERKQDFFIKLNARKNAVRLLSYMEKKLHTFK